MENRQTQNIFSKKQMFFFHAQDAIKSQIFGGDISEGFTPSVYFFGGRKFHLGGALNMYSKFFPIFQKNISTSGRPKIHGNRWGGTFSHQPPEKKYTTFTPPPPLPF